MEDTNEGASQRIANVGSTPLRGNALTQTILDRFPGLNARASRVAGAPLLATIGENAPKLSRTESIALTATDIRGLNNRLTPNGLPTDAVRGLRDEKHDIGQKGGAGSQANSQSAAFPVTYSTGGPAASLKAGSEQPPSQPPTTQPTAFKTTESGAASQESEVTRLQKQVDSLTRLITSANIADTEDAQKKRKVGWQPAGTFEEAPRVIRASAPGGPASAFEDGDSDGDSDGESRGGDFEGELIAALKAIGVRFAALEKAFVGLDEKLNVIGRAAVGLEKGMGGVVGLLTRTAKSGP